MHIDERLVGEKDAKSSQVVRIFDIFIFAPLLIYIGITGKITPLLKIILILLSIATILYNGYYFIRYYKK